MAIIPDTKDWTWVLDRACPECGFDTSEVRPDTVGDLARANAEAWQSVLTRPDVVTRPNDARWSPLEYACHVRDVFRIFDRRLELVLTEDDPTFVNWDQDVTAVEERYAEQHPATVTAELIAAAGHVTARFDAVRRDQWQRTGTRSDGARFTVATMARYFIHDPVHHLWDVGADESRAGGASSLP